MVSGKHVLLILFMFIIPLMNPASSSFVDGTNVTGVNTARMEITKISPRELEKLVYKPLQYGNCTCYRKLPKFARSFKKAYAVVGARMFYYRSVYPPGAEKKNMVEHVFYTKRLYRGPKKMLGPKKEFIARTLANNNVCGVSFYHHLDYLLFLRRPKPKRGKDGEPVFIVGQCSPVHVFKKTLYDLTR